MRRLIATACDGAYFDLFSGLARSLRPHLAGLDAQFVCFDIGLSAEHAAQASELADAMIAPGWDIAPGEATPFAQARLMRPFIPRYCPGFDAYLWLDADLWVQEPAGLELLFAAALRVGAAGVSHDHPSYAPENRKWLLDRLGALYDPVTAGSIAQRLHINSGVLAFAAGAPHWRAWRAHLGRSAGRPLGALLSDQAALHGAIALENLPIELLPARLNWLPYFARPLWHRGRAQLCEPIAPFEPISVIHLAALERDAVHRLSCVDAPPVAAMLTFDGIAALRETERAGTARTPPETRVSAVIRTFDRRGTIGRAIRSALDQSVPPHEVIVVDDGSHDDTPEWIARHFVAGGWVRLVRSERNEGAASAANRGLAAATGEFIAFLDSDDEWHPRFLELHLAMLADDPAAQASYSDLVQVWDETSFARMVSPPFAEDAARQMLLTPFIGNLSTVVFRHHALDEVGAFDGALKTAADFDVLLRLALRHPNGFRQVALPVVRRHLHGANLRNDFATWHRESATVLDRALQRPEATALRPLRGEAMARLDRRASRQAEQRAILSGPPRRSVSVVIATRNRREMLARALASVDRQKWRPLETIVVDDGSSDGTASFVSSLARPDIRVIPVPDNRGIPYARNLGWRAASGDLIAMLDDDDKWLPDYLRLAALAFDLVPEPLFVYADCLHGRSGETPYLTRHDGDRLFPDLVTRMLYLPFPVSSTVFVVARDRLARLGGYDERYRRCEDAELYLRLAADDPETSPVCIEAPHAVRLLHDIGRDARATAEETLRYHKLRIEEFVASPAGRQYAGLADDAWRRLHALLAQQYLDYGGFEVDEA